MYFPERAKFTSWDIFKIALLDRIFMINEHREIKICKHKLETECISNVAFLIGCRMASGKQRHF